MPSNSDSVQITVQRDPTSDRILLHTRYRQSGEIANGFNWTGDYPGSVGALYCAALTRQDAQTLMDTLYRAGLRVSLSERDDLQLMTQAQILRTQDELNPVAVAMQAHLADLRVIAFAALHAQGITVNPSPQENLPIDP